MIENEEQMEQFLKQLAWIEGQADDLGQLMFFADHSGDPPLTRSGSLPSVYYKGISDGLLSYEANLCGCCSGDHFYVSPSKLLDTQWLADTRQRFDAFVAELKAKQDEAKRVKLEQEREQLENRLKNLNQELGK